MTPLVSGRVAVLMGGLSSEREVSLNSGKGVFEALLSRGYDVVAIDWQARDNIAERLTEAEVHVVWNALHGTYGEDGAIQGLLACLGIRATGAGVLASALAMDKVMSKQIFRDRGVPTPRAVVTSKVAEAEKLGVPCVVKPPADGSSVGVTIVREASQLGAAFELAAGGGLVLVEEFVAGAEINVGILDHEVLGSVEIRPASGFYDYEAKYKRSDTTYLVPPELPDARLRAAEEIALSAHAALGITAYSRVDLIVPSDGSPPTVLEVNTLPGMTATSLLPKIAAGRGMDYATLCERILALALA